SGAPGGSGGPGSSGGMTAGELRLSLIDQLGPRWYCDPDFYPVAHGDPQSNAIARFSEMQTEAVVFKAVVDRLGLAGKTTFTDAEKLAIYTLWKVAISIPLDPICSGNYRFDYLAEPRADATEGTRTAGTISDTGQGEIRVGDAVDGSLVTAAELLPYTGGETFDLVASGDTGAYFAGGIPMGSTLLPKN